MLEHKSGSLVGNCSRNCPANLGKSNDKAKSSPSSERAIICYGMAAGSPNGIGEELGDTEDDG